MFLATNNGLAMVHSIVAHVAAVRPVALRGALRTGFTEFGVLVKDAALYATWMTTNATLRFALVHMFVVDRVFGPVHVRPQPQFP